MTFRLVSAVLLAAGWLAPLATLPRTTKDPGLMGAWGQDHLVHQGLQVRHTMAFSGHPVHPVHLGLSLSD